MSDTSQKRALRNYRRRLKQRGLARFEVLAPEADRDLIRSIAKRLAEDDKEAAKIRAAVRDTTTTIAEKGGILAALRRSPMVGAELQLTRGVARSRKVDL